MCIHIHRQIKTRRTLQEHLHIEIRQETKTERISFRCACINIKFQHLLR